QECLHMKPGTLMAPRITAVSLLFGFCLLSAGIILTTVQASSAPPFITSWGSPLPDSTGQFIEPRGVAVDPNGNIFVADTGNNRIQEFNSSGVFLRMWGSAGFGDGQFAFLQGIAADSSGNVYAADGNTNRIQKFSPTGALITKWGSGGSGDGQFNFP